MALNQLQRFNQQPFCLSVHQTCIPNNRSLGYQVTEKLLLAPGHDDFLPAQNDTALGVHYDRGRTMLLEITQKKHNASKRFLLSPPPSIYSGRCFTFQRQFNFSSRLLPNFLDELSFPLCLPPPSAPSRGFRLN